VCSPPQLTIENTTATWRAGYGRFEAAGRLLALEKQLEPNDPCGWFCWFVTGLAHLCEPDLCEENTALASVRAAVDSGRLPLFPTNKPTRQEGIHAAYAIALLEMCMLEQSLAEVDDVMRWVRALFSHAYGEHAIRVFLD